MKSARKPSPANAGARKIAGSVRAAKPETGKCDPNVRVIRGPLPFRRGYSYHFEGAAIPAKLGPLCCIDPATGKIAVWDPYAPPPTVVGPPSATRQDNSRWRKDLRRRDKTKAGTALNAAVEAAMEDRQEFKRRVRKAHKTITEALQADMSTNLFVGVPPGWPMHWVGGLFVPVRGGGHRKPPKLDAMDRERIGVRKNERHNTPWEQRELELNVAAKAARKARGKGRQGRTPEAVERGQRAHDAELDWIDKGKK